MPNLYFTRQCQWTFSYLLGSLNDDSAKQWPRHRPAYLVRPRANKTRCWSSYRPVDGRGKLLAYSVAMTFTNKAAAECVILGQLMELTGGMWSAPSRAGTACCVLYGHNLPQDFDRR